MTLEIFLWSVLANLVTGFVVWVLPPYREESWKPVRLIHKAKALRPKIENDFRFDAFPLAV